MNKEELLNQRFIVQPDEFIVSISKKVKINIDKFEKAEKSHKGLVQREVEVKRGGKTFTQKRWVKSGEDEPEEREGKKVDPEVKGTYNIGDSINFLGKDLEIEKVSTDQKTVKLSNRKVYTFDAIEAGKRGISGLKYNINDEVNFNGEKHKIVRINDTVEVVQFEDGTRHSFDDIELFSEKPKKEIKIKDLKLVKKPEEIKKEPKEEKDIITGSAKDGSLSAKDRKLANKQLQEYVKKLDEEEKINKIPEFDKISRSAAVYTAGNSFSYVAYLLSDRKKGVDPETRGLKKLDKDEKEWYEKKIKMLDKFLDDAPKVKGTSYRGMTWDLNNSHEKKLYENFISEIKVGNTIESKPYASTTASKKILESYSATATGKVARIEYETKSGVYIESVSGNPEQEEVLLPHNMKFKVIKNDIDKYGDHLIKLQEV